MFAVPDRHLWNTVAGGSTGNTGRCCWPSRAAAPPRWAGIATAAPAADIRPGSPTTRAETGIAQDARATRAALAPGARTGTAAHSLRPRGLYSAARTGSARIAEQAADLQPALPLPAPRPCLKSLAIHGISEPRSVSSACSTAGISACSFIRMSTASLPPAVSRRITQAGSPPGAPSFCPSACSAASSAASSSLDSATHFIAASFSSTAA